ncbi:MULTISPECIES: phage integrase SAM-like domain-containing protein [Chitinophagaceae]
MNIMKRRNSKGDKILFYYDFGRAKGQRPSTGIFVYTRPKNAVEKSHNREALALLEVKKSEAILESQAVGSSYIPRHKFKDNFLDYFQEYINEHKRAGNRHLTGSLRNLKIFIKKDFLAPIEINENFCKKFKRYLLDTFNGETPGNYYSRFKWVLASATSDGYFRVNPTANIYSESNPSVNLKENLEVEEYIELLNTPFFNEEVKMGFILSCYTGLRWIDVKLLKWKDITGNTLTTRIIQKKTGRAVALTLHPIALTILKKKESLRAGDDPGENVFLLPTQDGCNKVLATWIGLTSIKKHITWSCARLSFSILLKDRNVDDATIAYLMGHTTTYQVQKTYKRHRPKDQQETISMLPSPELMPYFLDLQSLPLKNPRKDRRLSTNNKAIDYHHPYDG